MGKEIVVLTEDQVAERNAAIEGLNNAMGEFSRAIMDCHNAGIPLADAFESIGIEVPKFVQPILNQLSSKLSDFVPTDT